MRTDLLCRACVIASLAANAVGCGSSDSGCKPIWRPAAADFVVVVLDAQTGERLCDATVVINDDISDGVTAQAVSASDGCRYEASDHAYQPSTVSVQREGYVPVKVGIHPAVVDDGPCSSERLVSDGPIWFEVELTPTG